MRRKLWEYKTTFAGFNNFMDSHTPENPNEMGRDGWEMVHFGFIHGAEIGVWMLYKRELDISQ